MISVGEMVDTKIVDVMNDDEHFKLACERGDTSLYVADMMGWDGGEYPDKDLDDRCGCWDDKVQDAIDWIFDNLVKK